MPKWNTDGEKMGEESDDSNNSDGDSRITTESLSPGRHDVNEIDGEIPDLPGEWVWNRFERRDYDNGGRKVWVWFGKDENEPGGWLGEIDNFERDGEEVWQIHIREIKDNGTESGIPNPNTNTNEKNESIDEAINSVPDHIKSHDDYEIDDD